VSDIFQTCTAAGAPNPCVHEVQRDADSNQQRAGRPQVAQYQHLAATRMLFERLVVGQVVATNPAAPVRGPKYTIKKGKTPVLAQEEARELLDSLDASTLVGLRDRALIATMIYPF
jgi:site-specific recombinase XerC